MDWIDSAIDDMNKAIALDRDRGYFFLARGSYTWEKTVLETGTQRIKKENAFISDYKACLSKTPTFSTAWLDLIAIYILSEQWDDAISTYGQCLPYMDTRQAHLFRAYLGSLALILAGDPVEEEDLKALRDRTIYLDTVYGRDANICFFLGEVKKTEPYAGKWEQMLQIMVLFIDHFIDHTDRSRFYEGIERYDLALLACKDAIKTNDQDTLAWYQQGEVYRKKDQFKKAIKSFKKAIELDGSDASTWNRLGVCYKELRKYSNAMKAFEKSIKLKPDHRPAWYNRGEIYRVRAQYEKAVESYKKAIELDGSFEDTWNKLGLCLKEIGQYDDALYAFDKSLTINPGYESAQMNKENLLKKGL
jgi:tetratricopeptide (TPR) repeat protein